LNPIRILLVDDHALVRAGFRSLIESFEDIEIVAEAADGREAIKFTEIYQPDIVLMDIAMPNLNGLDATANILKKFPKVRVLILSMHINEEYVLRALEIGASGYLVKAADSGELHMALKELASGGTYLSPSVSKHVIEDYRKHIQAKSVTDKTTIYRALTSRQREILQLVAEGRKSREIALDLGISKKTVETHRKNIMKRLNIRDLAGLVRFAIRTGLVSED